MPPTTTRMTPRKRTRKRKRRVASPSSSSSSSDSESSNTSSTSSQPVKSTTPVQPAISGPQEESPSLSESSSESSDTDSASGPSSPLVPTTVPKELGQSRPARLGPTSPSPSPPPAEIPSFITSTNSETQESRERVMKDKFRKFWMASVADGFKDDLEQIRKEPNLGTSRLSLLIDALASGADVFSYSSSSDGTNINEMEVILEQSNVEQ